MNIYITGTTGFLGKDLVFNSIKSNHVKKIYCPIRDKYDLKGKQRFSTLFTLHKKCVFCDCKHIPIDTNIIVLNAFSTSFIHDIYKVFHENVTPTLNILKSCKNLPYLKKIILVSTAYTQPPFPYKINNSVYSEVVKTTNVVKHYNDIITSKITWDDIKKNIVQNI